LHADWAAAKKEAVKLFKEAQKNWLKKQDAKINASNDAKARKKALDAVLDDAGLDKGESLDDYLKFADGFGKSLDNLEKAVGNNQTAVAALNGATPQERPCRQEHAARFPRLVPAKRQRRGRQVLHGRL
jgi:hypothetical protein